MKTFVALAASLILCSASIGAPRAQQELAAATRAFEAGELAKVVELARGLAPTAEDWPRLQYLAGEAHLALGAFADAETAFRAVLQRRPQALPARVGLGRALTQQAELAEAGDVLRKTIEADATDAAAHAALGELLAREGKLEEACREVAAAAKLAPKSALVARSQVEVLLAADRADDAAKVAEGLAKRDAKSAMATFLLAAVREKQKQDREAIELYLKAIELDPQFLDAHKNLAILCHTLSNTYQDRQRVELAYEHYQRYFDLGGRDESLRAMHRALVQYKEQILGR